MTEPKKYLDEKDFQEGSLAVLDREIGLNEFIVAFAPIRVMAAGGFLAVSYLKNRESTGDIDYMVEPEFAGDQHIQTPLKTAIQAVARRLNYNKDWANERGAIFVTKEARQILFERAEKQGITLFEGENLEVLAAPLEWALERKLRRIYGADRGRKAEYDMTDALALLKALRTRNNGPLDEESIRTMNVNGFDVLPNYETMQRVAREYRHKYNEDIFR
ncbi:hypothetical protein PVAR5_4925 [Paecilomyces variotii No. 5]|uniref:Nucleotidyl transferase AbiEii toxin, Type IV TA system n=1 Tax=Byssochlamys spectabilis (strain No. 5 / NBRC 109023) TaxID=1356009 RepID=V5I107_BYSSN|nr:hypothetical protein PVAR5_4925 [Paecilomyces variotii No. 5]